MNMLKTQLLVVCVALPVLSILATEAAADPAVGQNDVLDTTSSIFIPLKPETSGTLGDLIGGGPGRVGLTKDVVTLSGAGDFTQGWVLIPLLFDLSGELEPGQKILSGMLQLTFRDLDFVPLTGGGLMFREWLELEILRVGDGPLGSPFLMNDTNYDSPDHNATDKNGDPLGSGFSTNNRIVTYEFDLVRDLGLTQAELDLISADRAFELNMTLYARLDRLSGGRITRNNTPEDVMPGDFGFVVPEPATVSLLALGMVLLVARRVRRS